MSKVNLKLLSQVIRVYEDRAHQGLAKTKTRGEVSISTRKIYKQKGTGGARHGAKSAPIFVGGGVAHGPKGVKRILSIPRKMAQKALSEVLKLKEEEKKVFVTGFTGVDKTKQAKALLDKLLGTKKWKGNLLIIISKDSKAGQAFRNIKNVRVLTEGGVSAYDVFKANVVVKEGKKTKEGKTTKK